MIVSGKMNYIFFQIFHYIYLYDDIILLLLREGAMEGGGGGTSWCQQIIGQFVITCHLRAPLICQ